MIIPKELTGDMNKYFWEKEMSPRLKKFLKKEGINLELPFSKMFWLTDGLWRVLQNGNAKWLNNGIEHPIKITGLLGKHSGKKYYSIEGSTTGIPADEVI